MTLKFKMNSEVGAREMKTNLIEQAEMLDFITLADVKAQCGQPVEMNYMDDLNDSYGWRYTDLKGKNIMIRQVRRTWYLYLCDPTLKVNVMSENPPVEKSEEKSEFATINLPNPVIPSFEIIDYMISKLAETLETLNKSDPHINHRKCMVIFRRGDDEIKKPAWFHEYEQKSHPSRAGDGWIQQKLAIVEYMDGQTGEVKPQSIRWEEWK